MDEDTVQQVVVEQLEALVEQIEDELHDTTPMLAVSPRARTSCDWPPEPPMPADVDLAQGTLTDGEPVQRVARVYAAVRRPTTSGD